MVRSMFWNVLECDFEDTLRSLPKNIDVLSIMQSAYEGIIIEISEKE